MSATAEERIRPKRVLVTGASGFVGTAVTAELVRAGYHVRAALRQPGSHSCPDDCVVVGDISSATDWGPALSGIDVVVHLAARVHVMRDSAADPVAEYRAVNTAGTAKLARCAAALNVKRFIFVSSIKVNGDTTGARPFTQSDAPAPRDPYGISKWEAECALRKIERETGLEVTVVRPPLVYGPRVGGNFLRLLKVVQGGIPLPLGAVENQRSMIYVKNLASALVACVSSPAAAGGTFLVSDGHDLSTPALIKQLSEHLGVRARLVSVSPTLLKLAATVVGRRAEFDRLFGSLVIDASAIREQLGWTPPYDVASGFRETAAWFKQTQTGRHV